ncbi:hypothetical protein RD792_007507 [Penstemon davidsonii]|uniref:RING-type domain-containing protein n=1 Tax=Penstemon davidsonii TaxID=160366 RepID=A0ABR0D6N4_9LAMI|nr:hypothetical protein RD792_007507 [Penstemon davidsonii]
MHGAEGIGNGFGTPIGYGMVAPSSGTTTATEAVFPMYGYTAPAKNAAMKSESRLTYAVPTSRKRSRDMINPVIVSSFPNVVQNQNAYNRSGNSFTFLGEDITYQIQHQQLEIDRLIAQHNEKVRMDIEEKRRRYSHRLVEAIEGNIMKKLKATEEEIEKIGKFNWALEERVKSLCVENQIWRDLAQTNEATAHALRLNLEQALAQVQDEHRLRSDEAAAIVDDAQSCCGSNFEETDRRALEECANISDGRNAPSGDKNKAAGKRKMSNGNMMMCRNCGKEESRVLLLPCRHLCLCTFCGSGLNTCPVCNSTKTASVHVNLSS